MLRENVELPFVLEKRIGASVTLSNIDYDDDHKAVIGKLQDPSGNPAGQASTTLDMAQPGMTDVTLSFGAEEVSQNGLSGKFTVNELVLQDVTGQPVIVTFSIPLFFRIASVITSLQLELSICLCTSLRKRAEISLN